MIRSFLWGRAGAKRLHETSDCGYRIVHHGNGLHPTVTGCFGTNYPAREATTPTAGGSAWDDSACGPTLSARGFTKWRRRCMASVLCKRALSYRNGTKGLSFVPLRRNEPPLCGSRFYYDGVRYSALRARGALVAPGAAGGATGLALPATGLAQYGHTVHDGSSAWPQWGAQVLQARAVRPQQHVGQPRRDVAIRAFAVVRMSWRCLRAASSSCRRGR